MKHVQPLTKLIILVYSIFTLSCKSNNSSNYIVSNSIDTSLLNFEKLFPWMAKRISEDTNMLKFDTSVNKQQTKNYINDLKKSFSIVYFYENDTLVKRSDSALSKIDYLPAFCESNYYLDTLRITAAVGFFAAAGVVINVYGNKFYAEYHEGSDGEGYLKYNRIDSIYVNDIGVQAITEKLILSKKPSFSNGEVLIGQFEGTFKPFYEKEAGQEHIRKVKLKVVFKCVVRNLDELSKEKSSNKN